MGLTLTVAGCTGSYPGVDDTCSGYLVAAGDTQMLLDAGPGVAASVQRHVPLERLDAVVLTHGHPDHWSDLGVMKTALQWGLGVDGCRLMGPAPVATAATALAGDLDPPFRWTTVADGDRVEVGGVSARFARTEHYVETLAVRVEAEGRSLLYTADTGPAWDFATLGPAPDVVLAEATLLTRDGPDAEVLHLTAREAGERARAVGAGRLLLTHLPPGSEPEPYRQEAEAGFGGPVEVVQQHHRYEI